MLSCVRTRIAATVLSTLVLSAVGCDDKKDSGQKAPEPGFGGSKVPEGGDRPPNSAHIAYQCAPNRCSEVQLIQVMHYVKKGTPETIADPPSGAMENQGGGLVPYFPPEDADSVKGYVVDKNNKGTPGYDPNARNPETTGDTSPYYPGGTPGDGTKPATMDDQPGNAKPGYKMVFEVCAYCSKKQGDPDFGKILDCYTWEMDKDTGKASKSTPQPQKKPTDEFKAAVNQWDDRHKFALPGGKL